MKKDKYTAPKTIKARNKWFAALTPQEQRIAIAKDVILQLELGKFEASSGTYFELVAKSELYDGDDLQKVIENRTESCSVCAIGAVFASKVRLGNNVVISKWDINETEVGLSSSCLLEATENIFSEKQMRLMEFAFEGDDINYIFYTNNLGLSDFESKKEYNKAYKELERINKACESFYKNYEYDNSKRMVAIMQNVITNNGEFII